MGRGHRLRFHRHGGPGTRHRRHHRYGAEMGVQGWAAAELLTALRMGLAAGAAARRTALTEQGSG